MTPLDRYMARVRFWLPIRTGGAVADEVRATVEALLADRAAALGRGLTDEEIAAELNAFGRPEVTASRYTRSRPLVSAPLMPAYNRVMSISIAALLIVQLLVLILDPQPSVGQTLTLAGGPILFGLLAGFASITLTFAVLTRIYGRKAGGEAWGADC